MLAISSTGPPAPPPGFLKCRGIAPRNGSAAGPTSNGRIYNGTQGLNSRLRGKQQCRWLRQLSLAPVPPEMAGLPDTFPNSPAVSIWTYAYLRELGLSG